EDHRSRAERLPISFVGVSYFESLGVERHQVSASRGREQRGIVSKGKSAARDIGAGSPVGYFLGSEIDRPNGIDRTVARLRNTCVGGVIDHGQLPGAHVGRQEW